MCMYAYVIASRQPYVCVCEYTLKEGSSTMHIAKRKLTLCKQYYQRMKHVSSHSKVSLRVVIVR